MPVLKELEAKIFYQLVIHNSAAPSPSQTLLVEKNLFVFYVLLRFLT